MVKKVALPTKNDPTFFRLNRARGQARKSGISGKEECQSLEYRKWRVKLREDNYTPCAEDKKQDTDKRIRRDSIVDKEI
jgi:hypothetical protein